MTVQPTRIAAGAEPPDLAGTATDNLKQGPSALHRRVSSFARQPMLIVATLILVLALGWATIPGAFSHYPADIGVPADRLQPPSANHWFGTDYLGRDTYSRTVHAAGLSLTATTLAVAIAVVIGTSLGVLAGFVGGYVDEVISRVTDILLSIPSLLLSMAVVTAMGFGTLVVAVAVGIGAIASFTRVTRSEVMRIRHFDFIEAAHGSGISWFTVLVRHALPNAFGPVAALAVIEFGGAVLAVAALSFLGFGAQPPTPEWGSMIAEGRDYIATAWWLITLPGLVVVALVLSANRVASAFDRRQAG